MANSSRSLFDMFRKKGMPERDAFFAVMDHSNEQHWHDRNRYGDEVKRLTQENKALAERIEKLEGRVHG